MKVEAVTRGGPRDDSVPADLPSLDRVRRTKLQRVSLPGRTAGTSHAQTVARTLCVPFRGCVATLPVSSSKSESYFVDDGMLGADTSTSIVRLTNKPECCGGYDGAHCFHSYTCVLADAL